MVQFLGMRRIVETPKPDDSLGVSLEDGVEEIEGVLYLKWKTIPYSEEQIALASAREQARLRAEAKAN